MKTSEELLKERKWVLIDKNTYHKTIEQKQPRVYADYVLYIDDDFNLLYTERLFNEYKTISVDETNCLSHELLMLVDFKER